jgi:chromosomal replication initiation ATPase DnaA|tara:strand:+ start:620 stop:1060 length:441 start_codon:yes stop_codon:yes gene_type:complete
MQNQEKLFMVDIIKNKLTVTESTLVQIVEGACNLTLTEIRSSSRRNHLVIARSILGYMLRSETGCTFYRVGEIIGRDHASVIKYVKDFKDNVLWYKKYKDTYNLIETYRKEQYSDISLQMMNTQIFQIESQLEILKQKQSVLIKNQ